MAGRDKKEGKLKGSVGKNIKQEQKMVGDNKTQEIKRERVERDRMEKEKDGESGGGRKIVSSSPSSPLLSLLTPSFSRPPPLLTRSFSPSLLNYSGPLLQHA